MTALRVGGRTSRRELHGGLTGWVAFCDWRNCVQTGGRCHWLADVIVGGELEGRGWTKDCAALEGWCSRLVGLLRCECETSSGFLLQHASWAGASASPVQFQCSPSAVPVQLSWLTGGGTVAHGAAVSDAAPLAPWVTVPGWLRHCRRRPKMAKMAKSGAPDPGAVLFLLQ